MKTVIIAEDELLSGQRLKRLLEARDFVVLGVFTTAAQLKDYLMGNSAPDWLFLDIELRDGHVFSALKQTVPSRIIFTTAYDDRALEAFRHGGMDYLLKPIDESKLDLAIVKIERMGEVLKPELPESSVKSIIVSAGKTLRKIPFPDICYFSSGDNLTLLHTKDREYVIGKSLEQLERDLGDGFFRISRRHIVNRGCINMVSKAAVVLQSGITLPISRQRQKNFALWFLV
ncbi:LytR/AlgR family response regulator transcription factor [Flavobacterium selenitireducens]|uniref:LytR/AlgR family response regulator transcription factor n=1 Tax=Flavobacterium selenitireducens TaxID=2722704 RepID=UPI00168A6778|nr:LytTR family DNA-binding domain-containing protein [Flavobacterium selenitireducens]MBD3581130.1 response regulator transcription factor [Flavobacterium selenitireducens]